MASPFHYSSKLYSATACTQATWVSLTLSDTSPICPASLRSLACTFRALFIIAEFDEDDSVECALVRPYQYQDSAYC